MESESWLINIQQWPVPFRSKHHMQRWEIAVQRILFSFSVLYNRINVSSPWPLLPCSRLEIIGITSFKDSYYGNGHVSELVSGLWDLISDSNKKQLPLPGNTWNFNLYYDRLMLSDILVNAELVKMIMLKNNFQGINIYIHIHSSHILYERNI